MQDSCPTSTGRIYMLHCIISGLVSNISPMSVILVLKTVFIENHSVAPGPLTSAPTWKLGHVADYYYLCFFMQLFFNTQIIKN